MNDILKEQNRFVSKKVKLSHQIPSRATTKVKLNLSVQIHILTLFHIIIFILKTELNDLYKHQ